MNTDNTLLINDPIINLNDIEDIFATKSTKPAILSEICIKCTDYMIF